MAVFADPVIVIFVRTFLVLLFAGAAISKLRHAEEFFGVVRNFRLLPEALVRPVAVALPVVELLTALGMAVPATAAVASAVAGGLLVVFGVAIALNVLRGRSQIDCGCFRNGLKQPLSWLLVLRNAALAAAAFAVAGAPLAGVGAAQAALGAAAGGIAMLFYFSASMLGGITATRRANPHLASKG